MEGKQHIIINNMISLYQGIMGRDYLPYKNHVHRIANFTLALKKSRENHDEEKIAIAAVFHDIGIWTAKTFDYLGSSVLIARNYLRQSNKMEWEEEIILMIEMHHKQSIYKGKFADNVEPFRRADLMDLSKGRKLFGLPKEVVSGNYNEFPMMNFRKIIMMMFLKNLLINPLHPLPMFKK